MTRLPDYEPKQLPEGTYEFTLKQEPIKRRPSSEADFVVVKFVFKVTGKGINSARQHMESLLPWDVKYGQLLLALGAKRSEDGRVHLSESVNIIGKSFTADIVHEPDKEDPRKKWARISNIRIPYEESSNLDEDDIDQDDIPF